MRITTIVVAVAVSLFSCLQPTASTAAGNQRAQQAGLHRTDFRVEGASCVTCLRRIAKAMKESKGVLKADVSIYKPYWAIVIYDSKQTSFEQLSAIAKKEKVRFMEVEDKAIAEMPLIVIPKLGNSGPKAATH